MATKFVRPDANGGDPANSGDSDGAAWTLKFASMNLNPGDVCNIGGTVDYDNADVDDRIDGEANVIDSGSAGGGYITYQKTAGSTAKLTNRIRIPGASYLKFVGLTIEVPTTNRWFDDIRAGSHDPVDHIVVDGCTFHNTGAAGGGSAIFLSATDTCFRNNKFKDYLTEQEGLAFQDSQRILIVDNDYSQARIGHSNVSLERSKDIVVRGNYFRNAWARILICQKETATIGDHHLVTGNLFVDCFYDVAGAPYVINDAQVIRWQVERSIFRNNLIVGSHVGTVTNTSGMIDCESLDGPPATPHSRRNRIYHNVIHRNEYSGVYLNHSNAAVTWDFTNNYFFNNVISRIGAANQSRCWKVSDANITDWTTNLVEHNLFWDQLTTNVIRVPVGGTLTDFTVSSAQGAGGTGNPALNNVFKFNLDLEPIFVNDTYYQGVTFSTQTVADIINWFEAYKIRNTSPGYQVGRHLATVTGGAGNGVTSITVDDALPFSALNFSVDGTSVTPDRIIVGSNDAVTIATIPSDTTITIATAINCAIGDKIYLQDTGTTPSLGVFQAVVEPPIISTDTPWFEGLIMAGISHPAFPTGGTDFWFEGLPEEYIFTGSPSPPMPAAGQPIIKRHQLAGTININRPGIGSR